MKSVKSYFNKPLFIDLLKRNWWFGFINLIVLFFGIPINFLLTAQRFTRNDITVESTMALHKYAASFFSFSVEGAMVTTILAMLAALVAGLVFFSYLHKKEQVNFFHSQPISRESLFTVRIGAGILLFVLPYIINFGIALIIAAISGLISEVSGVALIGQMGFVLLVFVVSYAIVVLAGILSGTVVAQAQMTMIIVFAPLLVYTSVVMLCQRFYDTYYADYFFQKVIYFSPVTHLVTMVSGEAAVSAWVLLSYIALAVVALVLALWLYLKRPSEGAGRSLIFARTQPVIKYVCCFIAAVLMGMFFDQLGGFAFMIFGLVAGLILCSLFAEAQFNRDFKAMFKNMKGLAILGLGLAIFIGMIAFDVTGYDNYLPAKDEVKAVSFTWDDGDIRPIFNNQRRYPNQDLQHLTFSSPQVKSELLAIVDSTLKSESYFQKPKFDNGVDNSSMISGPGIQVNKRNLTIVYELKSGRHVPRRYNSIAMKPVQGEVQQIIGSNEYKGKHAVMQLAAANNMPFGMVIEPGDRFNSDYRISKQTSNQQQIAELLAAIKADVQAVGETIDNQVVYNVSVDGKDFNARISIYENYRNTLNVIEQISALSDKIPSNTELTTIYKLEIRPLGETMAKPLVVEKRAEIEQILRVSRANWGEAMTLADDYAISIPLSENNSLDSPDPYTQKMEAKARDSREVRYFVLGKVPQFVRDGVK